MNLADSILARNGGGGVGVAYEAGDRVFARLLIQLGKDAKPIAVDEMTLVEARDAATVLAFSLNDACARLEDMQRQLDQATARGARPAPGGLKHLFRFMRPNAGDSAASFFQKMYNRR